MILKMGDERPAQTVHAYMQAVLGYLEQPAWKQASPAGFICLMNGSFLKIFALALT